MKIQLAMDAKCNYCNLSCTETSLSSCFDTSEVNVYISNTSVLFSLTLDFHTTCIKTFNCSH